MHGSALSPNDGHLLNQISHRDSPVERIYVSLKAQSDTAQTVRDRAYDLAAKRASERGPTLSVRFYDAESAHAWR